LLEQRFAHRALGELAIGLTAGPDLVLASNAAAGHPGE
jgi:hypothetical protein